MPKPEVVTSDIGSLVVDSDPLRPSTPSLNGIPPLNNSESKAERDDLTEEELLIATPVALGFSLAEKLWCERYFLSHSQALTFREPYQSGIQHRKNPTHRMESGCI
jgi:hypothetical protein